MKKRLAYLILFVGLFVGWLGGGTAVSAQTDPDPIDPPQPMPPLPIEPPIWRVEGLKIDYQRVNVTIEDQVATTHIDQFFVNDNDWMLEGTYLFPLPEGAAVSQLTMWVDGQPIEAKILEQAEERQIYDEIVRQLRDPALLEYVGTQAIQANVFPIPPRSERRIEIEYTQILPADNGLIHYVYPQSTDLYTNTPLDEQSIRVEVRSNEEIRAIYSPSHPVAISRDGDYRAVAGYEDANVTADKDFELYYTVSPEEIGLNLLSYREAGQDGFFLLLVAPSVQVDEVVAKDVLVVDTHSRQHGRRKDGSGQKRRSTSSSISIWPTASTSSASAPAPAVLPPAWSLLTNRAEFHQQLEAIGTNISQSAGTEAWWLKPTSERPTTIIFSRRVGTEGVPIRPCSWTLSAGHAATCASLPLA
ncbi:MAG: hypothetical protein H6669_09990 [Ardenticatenaceae bacterium]|nr:hypothetical protein [Ardenticatenaceae bacterium]